MQNEAQRYEYTVTNEAAGMHAPEKQPQERCDDDRRGPHRHYQHLQPPFAGYLRRHKAERWASSVCARDHGALAGTGYALDLGMEGGDRLQGCRYGRRKRRKTLPERGG